MISDGKENKKLIMNASIKNNMTRLNNKNYKKIKMKR
jgi:hypothetical protein